MKMATPNMLKNSVEAESERREMAVLAAADHIQHHGFALLNLVEALEDGCAIDSVIDLLACSSEMIPDAKRVEQQLLQLVAFLNAATFDQLCFRETNSKCALEVSAGILWHGSRLHDLAERINS